MNIDYLKRILTSKVYDVAIETPLDRAPQLSARLGNNILLKREDQFKLCRHMLMVVQLVLTRRTEGASAVCGEFLII